MRLQTERLYYGSSPSFGTTYIYLQRSLPQAPCRGSYANGTAGECNPNNKPCIGSAQAPGGGSIGTYKELCALATDLGQPELVYRFMVCVRLLLLLIWSRVSADL